MKGKGGGGSLVTVTTKKLAFSIFSLQVQVVGFKPSILEL